MSQTGNPQKISKNQRPSGPKGTRQIRYCPAGHELQNVLVVPVKGRVGMQAWCPCDQ